MCSSILRSHSEGTRFLGLLFKRVRRKHLPNRYRFFGFDISDVIASQSKVRCVDFLVVIGQETTQTLFHVKSSQTRKEVLGSI